MYGIWIDREDASYIQAGNKPNLTLYVKCVNFNKTVGNFNIGLYVPLGIYTKMKNNAQSFATQSL